MTFKKKTFHSKLKSRNKNKTNKFDKSPIKVYKNKPDKNAKKSKFDKHSTELLQKEKLVRLGSPKLKDSENRIPWGRTLSTNDKYLPHTDEVKDKRRTVVVIETNSNEEFAVVPLSGSKGKHRTLLKDYQDGKSYFKHFVEIHDDEEKPIKIGDKFKANHENQDVSKKDVDKIRNKVFKSSRPAPRNVEKIEIFRKRNENK